jgi:hypothetical protein
VVGKVQGSNLAESCTTDRTFVSMITPNFAQSKAESFCRCARRQIIRVVQGGAMCCDDACAQCSAVRVRVCLCALVLVCESDLEMIPY